MATLPSPKIKIKPVLSSDLLNWKIADVTGLYDSADNPYGYGSPNISSDSITTAKIGVRQYGETIPYWIELTIDTGTITAATLTAPNSASADVFSELNTTSNFPINTGTTAYSTLIFPLTWFGYAQGETCKDGVWTFDYETSGSYTNDETQYDFQLKTQEKRLISCEAQECIQKSLVKVKRKCNDKGLQKNQMAYFHMLAAHYSSQRGLFENAQANIQKAMELCQDCGCD